MKQGWLQKANINSSLSVSMKVSGIINALVLQVISRSTAVIVT